MNKLLLFSILFSIFQFSIAKEWKPLGAGLSGTGGPLLADSANQNLYVAGSFNRAGVVSVANVARWDGTQWYRMGNNFEFNHTSTSSLIFYEDELYAGSFADPEHGIGAIGKWTGTEWIVPPINPVPVDSYYFLTLVNDLEVFNHELYACGIINGPNGITQWGIENIARYNGLEWRSLNRGLNGVPDVLEVFHNELFVGGEFSYADTTIPLNNIAKWDGTQWSNVGTGLNGRVISMKEYNGDLYAGIWSNPSGIYKWDGIAWDTFAITNERVNALKEYNGRLYVGGFFTTIDADSFSHLAEWDGTQWNRIIDQVNGPILDFGIFQDNLHVGGRFTEIDSVPANYIAKWELTSGIKDVLTNEISIYPNPIVNYLMVEGVSQETTFQLYDLFGREMLTAKLTEATNRIEIKKITSGIYIYKIAGEQKTGKLFKE